MIFDTNKSQFKKVIDITKMSTLIKNYQMDIIVQKSFTTKANYFAMLIVFQY